MANPKIPLRLPKITHAYLDKLAGLGAYGKGKNGVAKRFIDDGIQRALEMKTIEPLSVGDFEDD